MRDIHIRTAMLNKLRKSHCDQANVKIVQEMGIWAGTVRVDIAVLNGEMAGYELKSDSDTLVRLPLQAEIYSRVFDRMTLVVGDRHFEKAAEIVPEWWGIVKAVEHRDGIKLRQSRQSLKNRAQEPYLIAELLRKDEALLILQQFGLAAGWRSKKVRAIHERLSEELPLRVLRSKVRETLKARIGWLGQDSVHQLNVPVDAELYPML